MRRNTSPPVIVSTSGATPSHMPLTRFAPIASRVSTSRCTTSICRPLDGSGCTNSSMSRAPPPRATMFGWKLFARLTDLLPAVAEPPLRALHVRQVHDLDLADQDRIRRLGAEAAARADQLARPSRAPRRPTAPRRPSARHMLVVDEQVQAETERQAHHADDVLDHLVGGVEIERVLAGRERAEVGAVDQAALVDGANALLDAELVEIRNARPIAPLTAPRRSVGQLVRLSGRARPDRDSITRNPRSRHRRLRTPRAPRNRAHTPRPRSPPPAPLTL